MELNYDLLEQYLHIMRKPVMDAIITVSAADLVRQEPMKQLLEQYQQLIKGDDIQVAGAYFASTWCAISLLQQYLLSISASSISLSLSQFCIQIGMKNGYPAIFYVLNEGVQEEYEQALLNDTPAVDREQWLGEGYRQIISPVFESIAQVTGLALTQVWGQIPDRVEYYILEFMKLSGSEEAQLRIQDDYSFLREELAPTWFGLKRNPFQVKRKEMESPYEPGTTIKMKSTCCLAYRVDNGKYGYCYACPKMTKEERAHKKEQIAASLATS